MHTHTHNTVSSYLFLKHTRALTIISFPNSTNTRTHTLSLSKRFLSLTLRTSSPLSFTLQTHSLIHHLYLSLFIHPSTIISLHHSSQTLWSSSLSDHHLSITLHTTFDHYLCLSLFTHPSTIISLPHFSHTLRQSSLHTHTHTHTHWSSSLYFSSHNLRQSSLSLTLHTQHTHQTHTHTVSLITISPPIFTQLSDHNTSIPRIASPHKLYSSSLDQH